MIKICKTDKLEIRRIEFGIHKGRYFIYSLDLSEEYKNFEVINNNFDGFKSLEDAKVRMLLESI